ncbi:MAG: hypothetical protein AABZ44_04850 [Elusimicrobiota bacterium]
MLSATQLSADDEKGSKKPLVWSFEVGYLHFKENPSFDISGSGVINVGGLSYASDSSGELTFEARQEGGLLTVSLPRWGMLSWTVLGGPISYEVDLPSGSVTNSLDRAHGYTAGFSVGVDLARQTMVTPQAMLRLSWQQSSVKPGRIHYGTDGASQVVADRFSVQKTAVGFMLMKTTGRFSSGGGYEIFRKDAKLKDLTDGDGLAGSQRGYRFNGVLAWHLSESETFKFEGSIGKEKGYSISLIQGF